MGWGVADGQTFEAFTEERLNREPPPGPKRRYEILNFAVAAYKLPQQVMILDRVFAFHPDIVLLAAHHITPRGAGGREMDARDAVDHMMERAKAGVASPFDTLRRFVAEAQVGAVPDALARRRLAAHADEIAGWAYSAIANACRRHGARPLLVFVPAPDGVTVADPEAVFRAPRAAGYQILDLSSAYAGQDLASLRLTTFDYHPNVRGNRLLADRLYQLLADSVLTPTFLARTGANTPGGSR